MAWLSGWNFRKEFTVSHSSGILTDYQMKLYVGQSTSTSGRQISCNSACKSDFSDLRFTTSDGETLLPYWIELISGTNPNQRADVWIKLDSIATTSTTFYMYFGNDSAVSASSGADTFIVFDDFERGSNGDPIGGDWFGIAGNVTISTMYCYSGTRSARFENTGVAPDMRILCPASENMAIQCRMFKNYTAGGPYFRHGNGTKIMNAYIQNTDIRYYDGSVHDTGLDIYQGIWYELEFRNWNWTAYTYDYYVAGSLAKQSTPMQTSTSYPGNFEIVASLAAGEVVWIDNVLVRNWNAVEPVYGSFGLLEVNPDAITFNIYWSFFPGVTTADTEIADVISPYEHTDLLVDVDYYYIVVAYLDALGLESDPSNEVSAAPWPSTFPETTHGNIIW